ncbi:unnamed protein product [Nippostrongylus brasiliensis]|uniref:Reverse transcriptase domain-containing protein n=1 Tax=Nippostrongylus brasiliensis TaxID=27835 RepID=A0A0N4Y844_NIPBR|nr:unnamed protein product [Nippostrongylus brasiliensis]
MELNALTLATRLANSIYTALKTRITITVIVLLSDSEIALSWIRNEAAATAAGTMVNNRVSEIRKIVETLPVDTHFGYVNTLFNPADCATRGVDKSNFGDHIWWKGPAFITTPLESWPTESHLFRLKVHADEATCTVSRTQPINHVTDLLDWKRHNDIDKCITTVGYVLSIIRMWTRHVNEELRTRVEKTIPERRNTATKPFITATERKQALNVLLRNHQAVHLTEQQRKTWKELRLRKDYCGILRFPTPTLLPISQLRVPTSSNANSATNSATSFSISSTISSANGYTVSFSASSTITLANVYSVSFTASYHPARPTATPSTSPTVPPPGTPSTTTNYAKGYSASLTTSYAISFNSVRSS